MLLKLNKIILIGLIISGAWLLTGYLFEQADVLDYFAGIFLGVGAYFGLFFGFLAVIFFVVGTSMFLLSRLQNYWKTLFPLNFGLTLLGISFFQYTDFIPSIWILFAFIFALIISAVLYKTRTIESKWLIILLIVLLFIRGDFWTSFVIGIIFISLAVAQGTIKNSFTWSPKH
jgi:hypothetical protein